MPPTFDAKTFAVRSTDGYCYYIDPVTSRRYEAMHVYSVDAKIEVKKVQAFILGKRMPDEIVTGATSKGSLSYYYCSDIFNKKIIEFLEGKSPAPYFQMHIENKDIQNNSVGVGSRHVVLNDCSLNSYQIGYINGEEQDIIKITTDFTFSSPTLVEPFRDYPGITKSSTIIKKQ